jgi:hypothetical protein
LHHEYFLLNRQIAREALEVLFKQHTVFLSCGPFVLQSLLEAIEQQNGPGRQWLKWLKSIALDWVTFPNLKLYPPDRSENHNEHWWEQDDDDTIEVDVDYIRGAPYNAHYDEHDHEGGFYDDNFYDPAGSSLYPSFREPLAAAPHNAAYAAADPFGFATHDPFIHPDANTHDASREEIATKLDLLVSMEVTPLFAYLASPTFALESISVPLYFISASSAQRRRASRPDFTLPLKIRYWVTVAVHALEMLAAPGSSLEHVRVRYLPWDIWASMDSADNLERMVEQGVWFDDARTDGPGGPREHEGEAFRAVWAALEERGWDAAPKQLSARMTLNRWDGEMDSSRVGDELEVVFSRRAEG